MAESNVSKAHDVLYDDSNPNKWYSKFIFDYELNNQLNNHDELPLNWYLNMISEAGIQVRNNFEIRFFDSQPVPIENTELNGLTLFATNITIPGVVQNMAELYYNGRKIEIPINYDYNHDFSITVINDAHNYIYSTLTRFVLNTATDNRVIPTFRLNVKTPDYNKLNFGSTTHNTGIGVKYNLLGTRIVKIGDLSFGYSSNEIQTFDIQCKCIEVEAY